MDYLNNVRYETSRYFRNKKKEYLKANIDELELTIRSKISGTCVGASMTLKWLPA